MRQQIILQMENFEKLRLRNVFYVDKTRLVQQWWEDDNPVTIVTRPRRFGKTLNLSMLNCFFSDQFRYQGEMLFGDRDGRQKLYIWDQTVGTNPPDSEPISYRSIQGTFPVISMTFNGVGGSTWDDALHDMAAALFSPYRQFLSKILESTSLSGDDKEDLLELKDGIRGLSCRFSREEALQNFLPHLVFCIHRATGKKPLVLLDEYDFPLESASLNGFYSRMKDLTDGIYAKAFRGNPDLGRAFLTGVVRVWEFSPGSGADNPGADASMSDRYSECCGFTKEETEAVLETYRLSYAGDALRKWYDGYMFGDLGHIYNPLSVSSFLRSCARKQEREIAFFAENLMKGYWVNTSSGDMLLSTLKVSSIQVKQGLLDLLTGKTVTATRLEDPVFYDIPLDRDAVWNMMLTYGYLTLAEPANGENLVLKIPNLEVRNCLSAMILGWFSKGTANAAMRYFLDDLTACNLDTMRQSLATLREETADTFDRDATPDPENFYHGLVLGMSIFLDGRFVLEPGRESGPGRYDISLEPTKAKDPAFVIEFRVFDPQKEKDLSDTVRQALYQLRDREYDTALLQRGISPTRIHHWGFAFHGREVLIGDETTHPLSDAGDAGTQET